MSGKPFAPACERNRDPILAVLREHFAERRQVLEIGSGTGQHAVHFAAAMPWLTWQCSDRAEHLPGIRAWLEEAALPNTPPPIELDVRGRWPVPDTVATAVAPTTADRLGARRQSRQGSGASIVPAIAMQDPFFDAAFSANTLHIMGWEEVEAFFTGLDAALSDDATLVVYGPFNDNGSYTSDSNREFDGWLKARDPRSGIRDVEAVDALARGIGLRWIDDVAMPANNRTLVWTR